jgi:hypothetical protein
MLHFIYRHRYKQSHERGAINELYRSQDAVSSFVREVNKIIGIELSAPLFQSRRVYNTLDPAKVHALSRFRQPVNLKKL